MPMLKMSKLIEGQGRLSINANVTIDPSTFPTT
jgi:hypothetical protein